MLAAAKKLPRYLVNTNQHEGELDALIEIFHRENVRSYLEIGSKSGFSLWRIANALPKGSRIISIDLPWGDKSTQAHLQDCVDELWNRGYEARLILGDSTKPEIVYLAKLYAPYDAVFVDANHTLPFVTSDWNNYHPMARMVVFHDIGWIKPPNHGNRLPIDVPQFWNEIKGNYRHEEIRMCERDNGIGVLWRE